MHINIKFFIPCTLYENCYLRRTDPTNNCFPEIHDNIFKNIFQLTRTKEKSNLLNLWILKILNFVDGWMQALAS